MLCRSAPVAFASSRLWLIASSFLSDWPGFSYTSADSAPPSSILNVCFVFAFLVAAAAAAAFGAVVAGGFMVVGSFMVTMLAASDNEGNSFAYESPSVDRAGRRLTNANPPQHKRVRGQGNGE